MTELLKISWGGQLQVAVLGPEIIDIKIHVIHETREIPVKLEMQESRVILESPEIIIGGAADLESESATEIDDKTSLPITLQSSIIDIQ